MLLMQHLKHPPTLNSLPERDRPIIAKALAKNPLERYKSCMELVETLMDAGRQPVSVVADESESIDFDTQVQESAEQGNTIIIPKKHQLPPLPASVAADYKSRTTVDISCPACGFAGRVPKKYQGQRVKCPQCSKKFRVEVSDLDTEPLAAPPRGLAETAVRVDKGTMVMKAVECPVCGHQDKLPQDDSGRAVKCSQCGCVYRE
jgi:hypothetical protein